MDGWGDTHKRSIHGVVAYTRGEMYFVDSHDTFGSGKSVDVLIAIVAKEFRNVKYETSF